MRLARGRREQDSRRRDTAMDSRRYTTLSISLHWLTVLLFIAVYATIEIREVFPKGTDLRSAMKWWHASLGLSIFALAWIRLALHAIAKPAPNRDVSRWQRAIAGATHAALYVLMIGLPIIGWLMLSAEARPVSFFGLPLPPLVGPDEGLAEQMEELHETVGTLGYWLIGIHATAALFHHYVLRDRVLTRMLPAR